jgi:iron complex outermembrane receptor protein
VVQRWRHTLSLDWEQGPYSATLSNSYLSGYTDQTIVGKPDRRVGAYTLWDLTGAWTVTESFTVRGGVKNLFDTAPLLAAGLVLHLRLRPQLHRSRGRFVYVGMQYKFK